MLLRVVVPGPARAFLRRPAPVEEPAVASLRRRRRLEGFWEAMFRRLSAARAQVHLWDAFTGACRGAYVGRDHLDELAVAYSVAFSPSGSRLFCGGDRSVRVFDTARCGVDCAVRPTAPTRRSSSGVKGLIGAVVCADDHVYAVGSYAGAVAVYDQGRKGMIQRSFNVGVLVAMSERNASTL